MYKKKTRHERTSQHLTKPPSARRNKRSTRSVSEDRPTGRYGRRRRSAANCRSRTGPVPRPVSRLFPRSRPKSTPSPDVTACPRGTYTHGRRAATGVFRTGVRLGINTTTTGGKAISCRGGREEEHSKTRIYYGARGCKTYRVVGSARHENIVLLSLRRCFATAMG